MDTAEVLPTEIPEDVLRAWDWQAELRRQDRSVLWLARKTGEHYMRVYRFTYGQAIPIDFLRAAARILGWRPE